MTDIIDFNTFERSLPGIPGLHVYSEFREGFPDKLQTMRKLNDSAWTKVRCDAKLFNVD